MNPSFSGQYLAAPSKPVTDEPAPPATPAPAVKATTSAEPTAASTIERVTISELRVDYSYQRQPDPVWVMRQAANFQPSLVTPLWLSRRPSGKLYIVDGQGRVQILAAVGVKTALAEIHTGLSPQDEADIFAQLNRNRRATQAWDHFKARRFAGDPVCVAIDAIVQEAGLELRRGGSGHNGIQAVTALEVIYAVGDGTLLRQVLRTTESAWPDDPKGRDGLILKALAQIFVTWGRDKSFNPGRLQRVLQQTPISVLIGQAHRMRQEAALPSITSTLIALAVRDLYNGRLRDARMLGGPRPLSVPKVRGGIVHS